MNVDETWLNTSDFRQMKWGFKGKNNNLPKKSMNPRISMIVGIDTLGNIYFTLSQSNSNSTIMDLFFKELAMKLDEDRPSWREQTVILLDNASYHCSKETIAMLKS